MNDQLVPEINLSELAGHATNLVSPTEEPQTNGKKSRKWSKETPEKRVELNQDDLNATASVLANRDDAKSISAAFGESTPSSTPVTVVGKGGGYKLDTGKPRWDLFPFDAAEEVTKVCTWAIDKKIRGDKAYPERNWEQGMTWGRCFRAVISHMYKFWFAKLRGENGKDEESGLSHLAHAATTVLYMLAYEIRKMDQFDDRPKLG